MVCGIRPWLYMAKSTFHTFLPLLYIFCNTDLRRSIHPVIFFSLFSHFFVKYVNFVGTFQITSTAKGTFSGAGSRLRPQAPLKQEPPFAKWMLGKYADNITSLCKFILYPKCFFFGFNDFGFKNCSVSLACLLFHHHHHHHHHHVLLSLPLTGVSL